MSRQRAPREPEAVLRDLARSGGAVGGARTRAASRAPEVTRAMLQATQVVPPGGDTNHPGSGSESLQIGTFADASGAGSIALGTNTTASDMRAMAVGAGAAAGGSGGVAVGYSTLANGDHSLAIGYDAGASADRATAIGPSASATIANTCVISATMLFVVPPPVSGSASSLVLRSPDGSSWALSVDDAGVLSVDPA